MATATRVPTRSGDDDLLAGDDSLLDEPNKTPAKEFAAAAQADADSLTSEPSEPSQAQSPATEQSKPRTPSTRIKIPRTWAIPGAEEAAKDSLPTVPPNYGPQAADSPAANSAPQVAVDPNSPPTAATNAAPAAANSALIPPLPQYFVVPPTPVQTDCYGTPAPYTGMDFFATPMPGPPTNPAEEAMIYRGKVPVDSQRPLSNGDARFTLLGSIRPPIRFSSRDESDAATFLGLW